MAHVIDAGKCVNCGACASTCPVEAIAEAGGTHKINAGTCIDCGACVSSCPVEAIAAG